MMKRLLTIIICCSYIIVSAQNNYKPILPYKGDTILNRYLVDIMHRQYAERKQRLQKALQTTETLQAYQKDVQMQYKRLFVNYPNNLEQVVPTVDSIKSIACDKYNILKLIINRRITCNLYLPHTEGKKPGILFLCGHEMSSKATESYQKTAILLANNGFVVLIIDPSGQGERVQLLDEKGKNLTKGSTTEHTLLSMGAGLVGWNEVNEMLIDNTLCLNYLSARPEVDATKIGCIGNSGGGAQTSYLSAMDKRIKAAACCSWFTQRDRMFDINGPDDGCQYLWNEGRAQLEIADYYIMQAPRPTLILAGKRDFIDYTGSQQAFEELKQVYSVLGQAQQAEYFAYDDGHGISQPKREVAVRFFRKYFLNDSTLIEEKKLKTLPDSMLRCTRSGQMLIDFPKEESLQMRNYQMTQYYERFRRSFDQHELDTCRSIVKQLLNLDPNPAKVKARLQSETRMHPLYEERNYIVMRKGEPDMPVRVMIPNNKCCRIFKAYILMCDSGIIAGENMALTDSIIQQGHSVIQIDPRGIGETKDQADKNNKKHYSNDYRNAALSLFIGRPLLGQRVTDILSAIDFVDNERSLRNCRIELIAVGNIGVAAMHAAFLDSRVRKADIRNCLSSWKGIIENPTDKNHMNLLVPNVLRFYDLDNLRIKNLETP